ncbi:MAG TPA: hypothetical protein VFZ78_03500 [Flavisolibacter sp.]
MNYFTLLWLSVMAFSCCPQRTLTNPSPEQGITGFIREVKGNRMPSPGAVLPEPKGIKTTLYIFEETNLSQVDRKENEPLYRNIRARLVKTVESDESGRFTVSLPPGRYSLFTKVNEMYFANRFDEKNNIHPVVVEKDKLTEADFLVDIDAVY